MAEESKEPLFKDINADDEPETTAIESLCISCEKNVSIYCMMKVLQVILCSVPLIYLNNKF